MEDYNEITEAQTDPGAPLSSNLLKALWKNPLAVLQGADGAPRVEDDALSSTITSAGATWVGNRYADLGVDQVGSIGLFFQSAGGSVGYGSTLAGSNLVPANANGTTSGGGRTGTWRCLGFSDQGSAPNVAKVTLWMRIS